ncbi:MAG: DUF4982 domain-containing protein [Ruminococcus sp.]|nr:DUF4982 domain-containing protein [Ruminococcus sp.]
MDLGMNGRYLWNDGWSFLEMPPGSGYEEALTEEAQFAAVEIPHDWLIYDVRNLYRDSTGWYRKSFLWRRERQGKKVFLTFEGVYMDSAVYLNGMQIGEWKYGYSAFTLDITEHLIYGENVLMVSANFRSPNSRWYSGAGIYRNVWLRVTEETYLPENAVYISTRKLDSENGRSGESVENGRSGDDLRVQAGDFLLHLETETAGVRRGEASVRYRLFDETGGEVKLTPTDAGNRLDVQDIGMEKRICEFTVKNVRLWDIESPALYTLETELILDGNIIQKEQERFGFRYTAFDAERGFFLNGRHLKLNGVCEHHDLGALGAAFNKAAMRRKFCILKEMGVNAVRGSHNMMAPGFMELADEMGIMVVSEAFDMWERSKTTYDYARFFPEWSARDVESWIRGERNHPCVIMWSIGNEIYDTHADAHGQELTLSLKKLVEKFDARRNGVVTIASNYIPWENAQKCADIVKFAGYNYGEKYYEEHHKAHPDWYIYGSETSSIVQSRGVYHFPLSAGILSEDDEQCSALGNSPTSWGAKSWETCVTIDRDSRFSLGQFLWSGFDYIGEPTPYHTKNSYFGQVDTAGFAKDSYYVWQSVWTDYRKKPMVHVFPYWDFNEGQLIDVRVCSNAPYVELWINGRSLGRQRLDHEAGSGAHILADYRIPYEKGVLTALAYDEEGRELIREEKHSFGNSAQVILTAESMEVWADGRDLLFITIETEDKEGNLVENACDRVNVSVTGAGRLVGLDNGDSTDFDSYKGTDRRLFNGKLLAIVQAGTTPGEIQIEVTGQGIKGAGLRCEAVEAENGECTFMPYGVGSAQGAPHTAEESAVLIAPGHTGEVPVRRIILRSLDGQIFTERKDTVSVEAAIEPPWADDQELFFKAVNDKGVPVSLVELRPEGNRVTMKAKGDGAFRLFAMSKSGTDRIRVMSQLEFTIRGIGQAYKNPYEFISAGLYDAVTGEAGNGNEKGVATARDGETIITYHDIDFGRTGSDEITIPIFALTSEAYILKIWEGVPGKEGAELLADTVYQKESRWNVYQAETYKLKKKLKGITSLSFQLYAKVHIKGFSFTRCEKAWQENAAAEADAIYGDSFRRTQNAVEGIGNNVSLVFTEMDFGKTPVKEIMIRGRAGNGANTIHVRFLKTVDGSNTVEESKQIVEFPQSEEYSCQRFALEPLAGKWEVTFIFLPGSCFDFAAFRFLP